jgi:hypothetical protein
MLRAALTAMSILLLLATAWLTLSLAVLNPPRGNLPLWFTLAAIFTIQTVLTLGAIRATPAPGRLRVIVAAGACGLIAIAVWRVRDTLTSSHFEGYNLLLGAMLVVQSALTLGVFAPGRGGGDTAACPPSAP